MSCNPERVTAYVDGALDAAGGPELEAHLAACPECRAQAEEERALRAQLRALPPPSPSPGLEARVRRSLQPRRRAAFWLLPLAVGLVALLAWARGATPFVAWELSRDHDHCFGGRRLPAKLWSSDPAYSSAMSSSGIAEASPRRHWSLARSEDRNTRIVNGRRGSKRTSARVSVFGAWPPGTLMTSISTIQGPRSRRSTSWRPKGFMP